MHSIARPARSGSCARATACIAGCGSWWGDPAARGRARCAAQDVVRAGRRTRLAQKRVSNIRSWWSRSSATSEQLEHVPESFKVIRHVRPKFASTGCDRVVAPAPSRPIERGLAAPNLLAHVIVSKYADHLPLFRRSEIYARQGVQISGSTMAGWVGAASNLLGPLVDAIGRHVFAGRKLHADDTPMPVLAPGNGKTKTGRLWTYVRDDRPAGEQAARAVWFAYSEDRSGEHPRQHLKNFIGALQADAYGASIIYMATMQPAGHMPGASSTTSIWRTLRPLPPKRWPGSALSMQSRTRSAGSLLISGWVFARRGPGHCSMTCANGWRRRFARCLRRARLQLRFDIRSHAGELSPAIPKMDCSRSTTAPPNGRLELSLLEGRTSHLHRTPAGNALPRTFQLAALSYCCFHRP